MSLYNERIEVRSTTGGHPTLFSWRGHVYRVRRVIDTWDSGPSGSDPPTIDHRLVRVAAESDGGEPSIADIVFDTANDYWTMRRLWG